MRVAFVGKGGSGKSTTVGTMARLLARSDQRTLVLDSDVMPGLAGALGIEATDAPIPEDAVEPVEEEGGRSFRLREGLTAEDAVEQYALRGPDGVCLLQLGKLRTEGAWTLGTSHHAFRQIARELPRDGWHLLGDLPGGTRQPFFGWGSFADTMVVVVEPTVKSFMTARRLRRLAGAEGAPQLVAIANKVESSHDVQLIRDETGLEVIGSVPRDLAVVEADVAGVALVDHAPDSEAVMAITSVLETMREMSS